MKNKTKILLLSTVLTATLITATLTTNTNTITFGDTTSYTCNDIVFGDEVVGTGSTKDVTGSYYTITNWTNAKHTDGKATTIGGTDSGKREGEFTINLKTTCYRAIVYACGYLKDAKSNIYLSINDSELKVHPTLEGESYEFKAYTFENINSNTLTFKNIRGDKKGRVCISKIVLRLK